MNVIATPKGLHVWYCQGCCARADCASGPKGLQSQMANMLAMPVDWALR